MWLNVSKQFAQLKTSLDGGDRNMSEDVNARIIKRIQKSPFDRKIKEFLLWAIREDFAQEGKRWQYKEEYDRKLSKLAKEEAI
jgi:hypothetical protein